MNKPQLNLQDIFLNQVRKENIGVTIYLIGGVQLRGMVRGFDAFTILLIWLGSPRNWSINMPLPRSFPLVPSRTSIRTSHREPAGERSEREPREPRPPVNAQQS